MPVIQHDASVVKKVWKEAGKRLRDANFPTPLLDARLLLQHAAGLSYEDILRDPSYVLPAEALQQFQTMLQRRMQHEPVAKIIEQKHFWTLTLKTNQHTLDPRPDSETLIHVAQHVFPDTRTELDVLDMGTGTGCLLLAILSEYSQAQGVGVDRSLEALAVAKENAARAELAERTRFLQSDWGKVIEEETFDLILANPPYIPSAVIPTLAKEVKEYDPLSALDGGKDGLDAYRALLPDMARLLRPTGVGLLEIGIKQEEALKVLVEAQEGLEWDGVTPDLAGVIRCVTVRRAAAS